ncbi:organic hydroperoxide resistance transcriptional regulator [hydrocarbon metagenome]|uniref:Organic hydroperoxide resistance transcriptional regulator n=1 Tax=hydrocarbon metagenome TaxID=938273 RepID=A0A0W8E7V8_9ZZZZ
MERLNAYVCFNMRAAMKKIDRLFSNKLEDIGISIPQSFILFCLQEENGLTLKEIGSRTLIDSSSMTVLVDKLEKDQLVKRQLDSQDRRAIRVFITEAGMEMGEKISVVISNLNTLLFDLLGEGNQKEFIHGLNNIVNGVED